MKRFRSAISIGMILAAALAATSQSSLANPDFTKKSGKKCVHCHTGEWSSHKYTEAGEYYKQHSTLVGFVPKPQQAPEQPAEQKVAETPKDKQTAPKKK
ncbi:MAG: hypothetical protein ABL995_16385 [Bryobacteraceae bacterium]